MNNSDYDYDYDYESDDSVDEVLFPVEPLIDFKSYLDEQRGNICPCLFDMLTVHNYHLIFDDHLFHFNCWNDLCDCQNKWMLYIDTTQLFLDPKLQYFSILDWFNDHKIDLWAIYKLYFQFILPFNHFVYQAWSMSNTFCKNICSIPTHLIYNGPTFLDQENIDNFIDNCFICNEYRP